MRERDEQEPEQGGGEALDIVSLTHNYYFWGQILNHNVSFWVQKLNHNVSFWAQKFIFFYWLEFWKQIFEPETEP